MTGPFLPDLFLSLIGILFLIRFFSTSYDVNFINSIKKYFYIFCIFYFLILISSLISSEILHSLESSLFYFRFGIFALAIPLIIQTNTKILNYPLGLPVSK